MSAKSNLEVIMKKSNTAIVAISAIAGAAVGAIATTVYFKKKVLPLSMGIGLALRDVADSLFKSSDVDRDAEAGCTEEEPESEDTKESFEDEGRYAPSMRVTEVSSHRDAVFYR